MSEKVRTLKICVLFLKINHERVCHMQCSLEQGVLPLALSSLTSWTRLLLTEVEVVIRVESWIVSSHSFLLSWMASTRRRTSLSSEQPTGQTFLTPLSSDQEGIVLMENIYQKLTVDPTSSIVDILVSLCGGFTPFTKAVLVVPLNNNIIMAT